MKKPKYWWALIVFLVAWSLWEIYPPSSENLITVFNDQADPAKANADATFKQIMEKARALEKANPDPHRQFADLTTAIGTNDIRPYFPYVDARNEEHPTYAILNQLQRKAAGKIKLGLDLQGGTEFLVKLDTSRAGSLTISPEEIKDWPGMIERWKRQSDPVSGLLWKSLSNPEQLLLTNYQPLAPNSNQVQDVVIQALNRMIAGPIIYDRERFKGITLRPETTSLLEQMEQKEQKEQKPTGPGAAPLNRLLLEDVYPSEIARAERQRLVSEAVEVLRRRVDTLGVAEPVLQPEGEDHILIQLPGLSQANQDEARANILKAAYLEFRMVHPQSDELLKEGLIPPGYEVLKMKEKNADGTPRLESVLVQKKLASGLTGKYIKRARPNRDPLTSQPVIEFSFDSAGAEKFADLTEHHIGERLAIVLDGELYTAPYIRSRIAGNGEISGGQMDINEAIRVANALENPLETPVTIDSMSQVDPTLGKDAISSGMRAAIFGTLAVAVFMALYYHRCGVIADLAMILNLVILLGVMCSIGTTLTLPGIAGIVLTVGMAVDANVLIYERLREEMGQGKSMRGAVAAAYSRAFKVIFDSHTTTLISAIVLWNFGTGPVKGFGVTLTIGVALSLFTSLVMTRLIFDYLLARGWLNRISMLHLIKNPHWDFMKWAKPAFIASWTIILVGMCYGIFVQGKKALGIDFVGGDAVTLSYKEKVPVDQIRFALAALGDVQIQYQSGAEMDVVQVVTAFGKGDQVAGALIKAFPKSLFHMEGQNTVGATVGIEIQKSALIASFLSLFFILFYVALRYEFSFSVGAVLAVIHDVLMTIGIFCLAGKQFSAPIVAAILTIIGFSINDTIVIFDRIREDLKLGIRGSFKDVMNIALNQTLSRTLITSGTVFLSTLSLFFFGGGVIHDFAFTFLVGIITGTYSSIYIASALVLWWHKGERPKSASQVMMEEAAGAEARV